MMNKLMILIALFFSIGIMAQDKLYVTGKITGIDNKTKLSISGGEKEKEFYLKDGVIDVEVDLKEAPASVFITVFYDKTIKYTSFFLGNEDVTIEASIDDFPNEVRAEGSRYDGLRYENYVLTKDLDKKRNDINKVIEKEIKEGAKPDSIFIKYKAELETIRKEVAVRQYEFLKKHINTDYGRHLIRFYVDQFTEEQFKILYSLVDPINMDRSEIKFLKALCDSKQLEVGDIYYDFTALDLKSKVVKFSDFFKEKYVLLDFSHVNCGYCYMAAPKTALIAEELKDKVMYVTYHTGDNLKEAEEYYELKGKKGNIIWNKEGDLHPMMAMYRNMSTPSYLLFSPDGKFIKEVNGSKAELKSIILEEIE
ncbi:TlpA family protein disulfide reductase [Myroides odoratimimus]|uniref:TlpA family protein disulfide reductase n=1 Tax=Myroides odoratimimus TaxID=76832 RepID=UPI0021808397|nr:thioredoxin family protein [Myroides odoratimimus]MCS7473564.1 thioredoxin family protein [Myroides odoratimimus]MEC4007551.1 thioredoxin family protein [Myroides odoratimimus]MEC4034127.1 thioredoxin family protein [Myroides odoratimimus]MEC4084365.1 thioredoxin family protein [Myroides odoratimimus]MEC4093070.1 thioredoxin family protein [Myroides odoratimimus]